MNDRKGLTITLTVIAVILAVMSVMAVVLSDSKGPKIAFEQINLTYVNGEDKTPLLEGVSAYDTMDGDVTASLVIKDITVMNSGNTAKVTYAARDKHNNITEAYRIVTYVDSDENYSESVEEISIEAQALAEPKPQPEDTEEAADAEELVEESEVEHEAVQEESPKEEPAPEEKKVEEPKKVEKKPEDKTPKITLKQKSVSVNVGQTFNPSDYIKSKENVSSIAIDGAINVMAPGTYPLTFKVTGPDGKTASEILTVTVK